MPVARLALRDDLSAGDVQGGEESRRPVPDIVVGQRSCAALLERQSRLRPIRRLDLALFVAAEDHGMVRCVEVKADNLFQLFGKERIVGHFEGAQQMWLEPMCPPHALDRARAEVHRLGHGRARPVRPSRRSGAGRLAHEHLADLRG